MSQPEPTADVLKELAALRARLGELEHAQAQRRVARRRAWVALTSVCVAGLGGVAFAASPPCTNGIPFCFQANSPALATEMNTNFAQLKTWLEAKTGGTGTAAAPSRDISTPGNITGAKLTATGYAPAYQNWNTFQTSGTGAGGAGIVNDNVSYRALMVVGNTSGGGARHISLFDDVTVNGALTVGGRVISSGYEVSCATGTSGYHFGFCCRMNKRTGATECKHGTSTSFTAWANVTTPFAATTDGSYSLSCAGHGSSANWPICCRTEASGATSCMVSISGGPLIWSATPAPW